MPDIHADRPDLSEYRTWANMKQRCNNPNHPQYRDWGGRGITVCDRWLDYRNFLADMSEKPKDPDWWKGKHSYFTLDRINNNLGYSPENCKWSTYKEQNNNRRLARRRNYQIVPGITGTTWIQKTKKWQAMFSEQYIGQFNTRQEAHEAYLQVRFKAL